jgi:hypothetical protein
MSWQRPIKPYHFQAILSWWDGTFKFGVNRHQHFLKSFLSPHAWQFKNIVTNILLSWHKFEQKNAFINF